MRTLIVLEGEQRVKNEKKTGGFKVLVYSSGICDLKLDWKRNNFLNLNKALSDISLYSVLPAIMLGLQ